MSTGATAGISAGAAVVALMVIAAIIALWRRRSLRRSDNSSIGALPYEFHGAGVQIEPTLPPLLSPGRKYDAPPMRHMPSHRTAGPTPYYQHQQKNQTPSSVETPPAAPPSPPSPPPLLSEVSGDAAATAFPAVGSTRYARGGTTTELDAARDAHGDFAARGSVAGMPHPTELHAIPASRHQSRVETNELDATAAAAAPAPAPAATTGLGPQAGRSSTGISSHDVLPPSRGSTLSPPSQRRHRGQASLARCYEMP